LPIHLELKLGAGPAQVGILFGLAALVYGVAAPLAGWASDRWGARPVMAAGLVACVLLLPVVALPRTLAGEMVALAAFGVACAILLTPTLPELAAACERSRAGGFGGAYAVFNLAQATGMVAGPVVGGMLKPALGFVLMLLTFSAVAALYLPLLLRRGRPADADQEAPPARAA
jgi:MFS family permease